MEAAKAGTVTWKGNIKTEKVTVTKGIKEVDNALESPTKRTGREDWMGY